MISTKDINTLSDIQITESELLSIRQYELNNLQKIYSVLEENNWEDVEFSLFYPKAKLGDIDDFNFKNLMDKDIIDAVKKLIKIRVFTFN